MKRYKYIFIDFPIQSYLYETNMKEIYIRKSLSTPMRFFRKLPIFSHFLSNTKERKNWAEECIGYKNIILFDTYAGYAEYCKKIEQVAFPETRLILYLLNPAFFSEDYKKISSRWEIWTFAEEDAKKFGFKYGGTFYNPLLRERIKETLKEQKPNIDLLFIGTDKGRKGFLIELKQKLSTQNIKCDFRIVDNFKSLYKKEYSREVSYTKLCSLVKNSNTLLDIVQAKQFGLTIRFMEALLFEKKIVTTNQSIIWNKDFKNNPNIYILSKDNINELNAFINKEFVSYPAKLTEKYSFQEWLTRLDKNEELK